MFFFCGFPGMFRQFQDNIFGDLLNGPGDVHEPGVHLGLRFPGRAVKQGMEAIIAHTIGSQEIKVIQIQTEGTICLDIDQMIVDVFDILWLTIRCQPP